MVVRNVIYKSKIVKLIELHSLQAIVNRKSKIVIQYA